MSHPHCTCMGSITSKGAEHRQCDLCARGARMVTIEVDNETWPKIQEILNSRHLIKG